MLQAKASAKASFSPFTGRRWRQPDEGRRQLLCLHCCAAAPRKPIPQRRAAPHLPGTSPRERGE
ncbi:hypothetical protein EOA34_21245, partial [Mesorhizobium sp. M4B.F.Ca.ET.013.02.1.1]